MTTLNLQADKSHSPAGAKGLILPSINKLKTGLPPKNIRQGIKKHLQWERK